MQTHELTDAFIGSLILAMAVELVLQMSAGAVLAVTSCPAIWSFWIPALLGAVHLARWSTHAWVLRRFVGPQRYPFLVIETGVRRSGMFIGAVFGMLVFDALYDYL